MSNYYDEAKHEIIEPSDFSRWHYCKDRYLYNPSVVTLTPDDIKALMDGKAIAVNVENEYAVAIVMRPPADGDGKGSA